MTSWVSAPDLSQMRRTVGRLRSGVQDRLTVARAGRRTVAPIEVPSIVVETPHDAGAHARALFDAGQFDDAEYVLWEVLRSSPRAPSATYLLGLTMLVKGKVAEGRRMIDRAYELRHWLDDRVSTPHVFTILDRAEAAFPEWDWPHYQRARERWRAVGLDLVSAVEHRASVTDRSLRFVQIGANDGRSGDPLRHVIARHRMSGLFVEPQATPFEQLQERYDGMPGLTFAQVAVTEVDGPVQLYTDPSRTTLGTLTPERNIMRSRSASAVAVTVRGLTFESLAREFGIDRFDVLQLDTEGFDYKILRQVPLDDCGVAVVNMEYFCLPVAERRAACALLEDAGFALAFGQMDLLAVRLDTFGDRFLISRLDA